MNLEEKEKKIEELLAIIVKNSAQRVDQSAIPEASFEEYLSSRSLRMILAETCAERIRGYIERMKKSNPLECEVFINETIPFLEKYEPARYISERDHIEAQADHNARVISLVVEVFRLAKPDDKSLDNLIEDAEDAIFMSKMFWCRNQAHQAQINLIKLTDAIYEGLGRTLEKTS